MLTCMVVLRSIRLRPEALFSDAVTVVYLYAQPAGLHGTAVHEARSRDRVRCAFRRFR